MENTTGSVANRWYFTSGGRTMTEVLQYFETLEKIFILAKDDERSDSKLRGEYYLSLIYIS
jgi:hypothetical protein